MQAPRGRSASWSQPLRRRADPPERLGSTLGSPQTRQRGRGVTVGACLRPTPSQLTPSSRTYGSCTSSVLWPRSTALDSDRPYMADLERDIVDHRRAAVGAAVTEIATLRAELSGPLHG